MNPKICVGYTSTEGIWIDGQKVVDGDTTGPSSTAVVLNDPSVDIALLEVARGGIIRKGLGYDWSDVGVITNIRLDHIGQDGIQSIDDLVWIKSLIAERVKENGWLIINADDDESFGLLSHPRVKKIRRNVLLYSIQEQNPRLRHHIANGGDAVWCERGDLFLQKQNTISWIAHITDIPIAFHGSAKFQISNTLAAIGAATASDIPLSQIINGILSFRAGEENNGRMNLFRVRDALVLLDYGHNPDAFCAVGEMLKHWKVFRRTAVLGVPGDRSNNLLQASATCASYYFDKIILRDDLDLRGRTPGEVSRLMASAIQSQNSSISLETISDQREAMRRALQTAQAAEAVVIFYDDYSSALSVLQEFGATLVDNLPAYMQNATREFFQQNAKEA